jgi:hypothetical protein
VVDFSAKRILDVWERGVSYSAEARTQALLGLVAPDLSTQALKELVLGDRNTRLLELRQRLFGPLIQAYIECSACGEALDLEFGIDELGFSSIDPVSEIHTVSTGSISAQVRLPNSHDLVALTSLHNVEDGRRLLFSRCVLELRREDTTIVPHELDEDELEQLENAISGLDPRMEILFGLKCPQCAHSWQSPLEISSFLWNEYDVYAKQLLESVHILASSYSWAETDILAMSEERRQFYLGRIIQ